MSENQATRPLALRRRVDLSIVRRAARGSDRWLIKDPLSLRYFELSDEEYAVLKSLDGAVTLAQLKEAIEQQFPPQVVTPEQLQALLHRYCQLGLVYGEGVAQTAAAHKARRSQTRNRWLGQIMNPLFIRFPGFDPDPLLRWLYPRVRWIFGPLALAACLALIATAAVLVAIEFDEITSSLPSLEQLFRAGNFVWLMAALAVSKALHELGHALTCKHFGGECHEIGVALMIFTPSLYCDTTDAWMIPDKWKRASVGAAGMAAEMVLAAACVITWRFSEPGLIRFLCLNIVFVCTVSTLLFNGNPLLRFDGYYILSDLLEIPNLWQTSRAALLRLLQVGLLGFRVPAVVNPHNPVLLVGYAMASVAYRWMIALGIVVLLTKSLRPYGLQAVGQTLLAMSLLGMVAIPGWQSFRLLGRSGIRRRLNWLRTMGSCVLGIALIAAILYVPIPHHVMAPFVLEQSNAERIYVTVPGILEVVYAQPGERVAAGAPIVKLTNLEVVREVSRLSGELDRLRLHLQNLTRRQGNDRDAADAIPATRTGLVDLEERLRRRRLDEQRLQLVAHRTGMMSPPSKVPPPPAVEEELPTWSGLPLERHNLGCYLDVGTLVCLVGNPRTMDALLIVDQSEVEFVRVGQGVEIKLNEHRGPTLLGQITQIAQIDVEKVPLVLSHKSGGEVTTVTDKSGRERPMRVAYQVRVPLPKNDLPILPGFHGRTKVDVGREPLGRRIVRFVRQTFML